MRQNKEIEAAKKKKTKKEELDSLRDAYQAVFSEEESDRLKDRRMERGGVGGNVDYSKAPKYDKETSEWGKKKKKDGEMSAFDKVVADLKIKHGDKAIMARKTTKKKNED